jgi:hypothetical protein
MMLARRRTPVLIGGHTVRLTHERVKGDAQGLIKPLQQSNVRAIAVRTAR